MTALSPLAMAMGLRESSDNLFRVLTCLSPLSFLMSPLTESQSCIAGIFGI